MTNPAPTPPVLPKDGLAIYDLLMGRIEPDLTSGRIETLADAYPDETEEQAVARAARYSQAFVTYAQQYEAYVTSIDAQVQAYWKAALASAEKGDKADAEKRLNEIDALLAA